MATITPFVDALVRRLADTFPELGGRVFAVTETDIDEQHIAELALPIMLVRKTGDQASSQQRGGLYLITEFLLVVVIDRTERSNALPRDPACPPDNGPLMQRPTYSYRDDTAILNRIRNMAHQWMTPQGGRVRYAGSRNESDQIAYTLEVDLEHEYRWCEDDSESCAATIQPVIEPCAAQQRDCGCKRHDCITCNE